EYRCYEQCDQVLPWLGGRGAGGREPLPPDAEGQPGRALLRHRLYGRRPLESALPGVPLLASRRASGLGVRVTEAAGRERVSPFMRSSNVAMRPGAMRTGLAATALCAWVACGGSYDLPAGASSECSAD